MKDDNNHVLGAVEHLIARANDDPALRERLVQDPSATITSEAGLDVPQDWDIRAVVRDDGVALEFANSELPDEYLELVSGGCQCHFRDDPLPPGVSGP